MNRAEPTFDTSLRHIAEYDFERSVFGHAVPLHAGASAAFRRFVNDGALGRGWVHTRPPVLVEEGSRESGV